MSDLQSDLPEPEDDNSAVKFATLDELTAEVCGRPNVKALIIYETDDGRVGYQYSGGMLWADSAIRYVGKCVAEDVEKLRQQMQANCERDTD